MIQTEPKRATTQQATYELLCSKKTLDGLSYSCYGICLRFAGTAVKVEDLSLNRAEVEQLVERCNRLELSPLHFQEVLNDFMER